MGRFGIYIIIAVGLLLRLLFINKPEGLWNDEYISWFIAQMPLFNGFVDGVKSQCHMPFYYLYLKFFMTLFGQSDLLLRLTSVFAGVLSIIVMYFVGLEKGRKIALYCAGFTAMSSFLIYYSQEVRFYSILFVFSALALLYTIRTFQAPNKKNMTLCLASNFMIIFTHTIGFVFVFFNLLGLSIYLFKQYKKVIILIWSIAAVGMLSLTPLIYKIFTTQSFSQWWGSFSPSKIGFLITDYFSPVLTNLTNAPDKFFYNLSIEFILFALIPSIIALFFILRSLKNRYTISLFAVAFATVTVMVIAAISGKLVFITKYSIEIYPILILLMSIGIATFKKEKIRNTLVWCYCILCFAYMFISPKAAFLIKRQEGHNIVAQMLNNIELGENDTILLNYYPEGRFSKYYNFSGKKVVSMHKGNFADYLTPDTTYADAYKNGKEIYKPIFTQNENPYFTQKLTDEHITDSKNIALVILKSVAFLNEKQTFLLTQYEKNYDKTPLLFLVFSYIKNQTVYELSKTHAITDYKERGSWAIIRFTKLNK